MHINYVLLLIFLGCAAALATGGIWNNLIKLFNITIAALLAVNYWEPAATWLEGQASSLTYLLDFVALWAIFGLSMLLFTVATDALSKVKVRFPRKIDQGVGIFLGCWVAWILLCFTSMTLHTAPLARHFLGFQPEPSSKLLYGLAPDRVWLSFVHKESQGALSRSVAFKQPNGQLTYGVRTFDPDGGFVLKYGERRARYEKELSTTVGR
jgi:hypothetical protein